MFWVEMLISREARAAPLRRGCWRWMMKVHVVGRLVLPWTCLPNLQE